MARKNNFLLGNGEKLVTKVVVPQGGGPKTPPYDFPTARTRVRQKLGAVQTAVRSLPALACPRDEAVAILTMHPRYISKSDFPDELLGAVGMRVIGSRAREIQPDKWGIKDPPETAVAEDIFIAGQRTAFDSWVKSIGAWTEKSTGAKQLVGIEDVSPFQANAKLRSISPDVQEPLLEVVLQGASTTGIVDAFEAYAKSLHAKPILERRRQVRGLIFIPVRVDRSQLEALARFAFLRVARGMPAMRPLRPTILRVSTGFPVTLPTEGPTAGDVRAVVFDGGLPASHPLGRWVKTIEPAGIDMPLASFQEHGLAVTTALLFGPIRQGEAIQTPLSHIDHVRVLDCKTGAANDLEYVDVLDRITKFLDANPGKYAFANLSLGPSLAITDDEVTAWTAALDERFAHGRVLATVAVGNDGHLDGAAGLNRVQPPSDGVNVLAVGAATTDDDDWARADYSCVGPGRCPGIVKPDGLAFGGSADDPFHVLAVGSPPRAEGIQGTSFAAPYALRMGISGSIQLGPSVAPLALRALLVHRADAGEHARPDVGWGRFESDPHRLITTDDDEAIVIFQGTLPVGVHLRAPVPLPRAGLSGMVTISATLVISPEVDPEHPGAYTRSGLEVSFRPHADKFDVNAKTGTRSAHATTKSFFSASNLYGVAKSEFREGGHKWEPCLRCSQRLRADSLKDPCFDIYYHHRVGGTEATSPQPIPYALLVGVRAPKVADLYNKVVRAYANVLVPIRPLVTIPVRI